MEIILINTISVSTKYLPLKDVVMLRLVCKKLSGKISQEVIVGIIKQKYSRFLKYGNKLLINYDSLISDTINDAHFIKFKGSMLNDCYTLYMMTNDLRKLEYSHNDIPKNKVYPFTSLNIEYSNCNCYYNCNCTTKACYYLDINKNKIVSIDSKLRKVVDVSQVRQIANLIIDVVNPMCNSYAIKKYYGECNIITLKVLLYVAIVCMYIYLYFYW